MRAEVKMKVRGKTRTFALPLGAMEEISAVFDMPRQLGIAIASGFGKHGEIRAIVEAGAKWGDVGDLTVDELFDEIGNFGFEKLALDLWSAAWKDDSGNLPAARKAESAPSKSGNGS